jgi:diguanylate cyclase (GGDEF)-like protein/PAS domain S-box-containing protein
MPRRGAEQAAVKDQDAEERQIAGRSETSGQAVHQKTQGITPDKTLPSNEVLSPVELRQMLHDLNEQKIELELRNADLLRKLSHSEYLPDEQTIQRLFQDYLRTYSSRDDQLTSEFSEDFSGFTGGGDFLVKDKERWVAITRQDFAQIKDPIRIELKDMAIQPLAETIAVATGFFNIHLPIKDHILSHEMARLVLIFRKEAAGWKICHSSISIPYHLVSAGEIYPLKQLTERNESLEKLIDERTNQLSALNGDLATVNDELANQIAQHKLVADSLKRSEALYRSIVHASPDDITITDCEGHILLASPVALTMFGVANEEDFQGSSVFDFIVPEDRARALSQIAQKGEGAVTGPTEYRGRRVDGSTLDIEANSEFIRDADGSPTGMVLIVRDISGRKREELEQAELKRRLADHAAELERLNALLREQAFEDSLTGLANRRQFAATLDYEIRRARRNNGEISLLIADVDFFKRYNDTFGHQQGDECLKRVAQIMKSTFRRTGELPARYGGEEFAVILPNCGPDIGKTLAELLRKAVEEAGVSHPSSDVAQCITLSIGIASARVQADTTPDLLIRVADNALYLSKAEGRNRVTTSTVGNEESNAKPPDEPAGRS